MQVRLNKEQHQNVNEILENEETQHEEQINMIFSSNYMEQIREDSEEDYMANLISPSKGSPTPTKLDKKFGITK